MLSGHLLDEAVRLVQIRLADFLHGFKAGTLKSGIKKPGYD